MQQVLSGDSVSARSEILARFCRFFKDLRRSPSHEVACLANFLARDIRSCLGGNLYTISTMSGKDPWVDSPKDIKRALIEAEKVEVQNIDKWRVQYLGVLLEQRMRLHYAGLEDEKQVVQQLIDSLCIN